MPPLVVLTEHLDPTAKSWLAERCEVVSASPEKELFDARAAEIEALVVRTYTTVDAQLLERLPKLKVVGRAGVGVDNIDLAACHAHGVRVVHTPDANTQAVVEYVTSLLCDALRPRVELDNVVSKNEWASLRSTVCAARQMNELTLGILGLGRIGRRVAEVARAIGFAVNYNDVLEIPVANRAGATPLTLEELLASSDVLTIHIDGRASNHGFINEERIQMLPDNGILINTSRGFVIDEPALAGWLQAHPSAMAILDVHQQEPFDRNDPLLRVKNARLLPHLASRTNTALANMSWVVKDVWAVLEGNEPVHDATTETTP